VTIEIKDEEKVDSSTATTDEEKVESSTTEDEERADSEESEDGAPKGSLHKDRRWQEVYGAYKEYRSLGSPEEIRETLDAARRLLEEQEQEKHKTDDQRKSDSLKKEAYQKLLEIAPGIKAAEEAAKAVTNYRSALDRRAFRETGKLMKENGFPIEEKDVADMARILTGIIQDDEELTDDYFSGNPGDAVRGAFGRFHTKFKQAAERSNKADVQRKKEKLNALPRTHRAGGSLGERGGKEPEMTDIKDFHRAAREYADRLKEQA
jgi:hypothetical protein